MIKRLLGILSIACLVFLMFSCSSNEKRAKNIVETKVEDKPTVNPLIDKAKSVFIIQTFDGDRILETGQGFMVTRTMMVAPFSLFKEATRAKMTSINGSSSFEINSFYTYDRINNLMLLKVDSTEAEPLIFYGSAQINGLKTFVFGEPSGNTQPLFTGSCQQERIIEGRKLFSITNNVTSKSQGIPIFLSNGSVLGLGISVEVANSKENFAIPASEIVSLTKKAGKPQKLSAIGSQNSKRNASISSIVLETTYGNISIKLYNETPSYRDNFVKLAEEGFFDSLLIHRVIRDFGIQTGAADTRHAKNDDIVGWKGPGYTLPAHIVPGLYHKRGAIGSPRKPDTKNKDRRSDGSQFYIVTGRIYLEDELNEIEKEKSIKFTDEQRTVYKTIGGAPHLDGTYTVFGEVVSGLDVADKISLFPVKDDFRPLTDIRLKHVRINY